MVIVLRMIASGVIGAAEGVLIGLDLEPLDLHALRFKPAAKLGEMFAQHAAGRLGLGDNAGPDATPLHLDLDPHTPQFGRSEPQSHRTAVGSEVMEGLAHPLHQLGSCDSIPR